MHTNTPAMDTRPCFSPFPSLRENRPGNEANRKHQRMNVLSRDSLGGSMLSLLVFALLEALVFPESRGTVSLSCPTPQLPVQLHRANEQYTIEYNYDNFEGPY